MVPVVHVPAAAVRVLPATAVPEIFGVAAVATRPVAADTLVADGWPAFLPTTLTLIRLPLWALPSLRVDAVAPEIALPSASHW